MRKNSKTNNQVIQRIIHQKHILIFLHIIHKKINSNHMMIAKKNYQEYAHHKVYRV